MFIRLRLCTLKRDIKCEKSFSPEQKHVSYQNFRLIKGHAGPGLSTVSTQTQIIQRMTVE